MAAGVRWEATPPTTMNWRDWARGLCIADDDCPVVTLTFFAPEADATPEWAGFPPILFYQPAVVMHIAGGTVQSWGLDPSMLSGHVQEEADEPVETGGVTVHVWDADAYSARVERALALLGGGSLGKVVLSRRILVGLRQPFNLNSALQAMLRQPNAFSICYSPDGERYFISATPERLGRIIAGQFETMALAGTIPRNAEASPDTELLLSDTKERKEHAYVVEMIRTSAESFAEDVSVGDARVLDLPHLWHIRTGISGIMREGCSMRHVLAALHPTPAVAGTPREDSQMLIAALEPFNRGLYAGCIGWFIGESDGDAAVTIRSALVRGEDALVWAGAGIVSESNAAAEERETRAKLQTMLDILGA